MKNQKQIAKLLEQISKLQVDMDIAQDLHWERIQLGKNPTMKYHNMTMKMQKLEEKIKSLTSKKAA